MQKRGALVFKLRSNASTLVTQHHQSPKRSDTDSGEKVEGINALPSYRELLGTYDVYLRPPYDEALNL